MDEEKKKVPEYDYVWCSDCHKEYRLGLDEDLLEWHCPECDKPWGQ